jgi:plasmid segregation protein ParM
MKLALNDSGKFQNKGFGDKEVIFRTMVTEIPKYNSYYDTVVELDGKFYAIGEGSIDTSVSKKAEIHRVCTLYAITQMFDNLSYGEDIYLVMGSPIQTFENADHKQEFVDFMVGDFGGVIEIKVNNEPFVFNLKDVHVLPESCGVVQVHRDKFKDRLVGVIDWGGLQVNCMIYDNGKPIKSTGFTRQLGGYALEQEIINKLNSQGYNYQEFEMKYVVPAPKEHEKDVVDFVTNKYYNEIIKECQMMNWNIKNLDLFFTGGTSSRLANFITTKGHEVSETAMEDNVRGYGMIGKSWIQKLLSQK